MAKDRAEIGDLFARPSGARQPLDDAQRIAYLRLIRSENVGPITFRELISKFGSAAAALDALPRIGQKFNRGKRIRVCSIDDAEAELHRAMRFGARPVFVVEPDYPDRLAQIDAPPPVIYALGDITLLTRPSVAIVGARQASAAGLKLAGQFSQELGRGGLVVVSGLARGIDRIAHEAALETGTVAVVAGGLDVIYPRENADLHSAVSDRGCLISEMPCGFQPRGQDFPRRNRLISGLSLGVLVVEAAKRSGTLITARMAGEQNRELFAIPGNPLDPRAEGTNFLLKNRNALLVTEPADILTALKPLAGVKAHEFREVSPALNRISDQENLESLTADLSEPDDHKRDLVLQKLGPVPIAIDDLARVTALDIRQVRMILLELDLAGLIERHGGQLVSLAPTPR
ncbi:MAG: DNA-processing protein DprA [Filomicrobium sp.]